MCSSLNSAAILDALGSCAVDECLFAIWTSFMILESLRDQSKWHLSTKKKTNSGYIVHAFSMFNSLLQIRSIRRLPRRSNLLQITSWHMSIQNHQELSCVDMSLEAMKHSSELLQIAKGNGSYSVSFSNSTWTHVKCVWIVTGLRRSFRCDSFIKFIQVQASFDQAVCHGIWEHLTEAWWTAQACVAQKEDHSAPSSPSKMADQS